MDKNNKELFVSIICCALILLAGFGCAAGVDWAICYESTKDMGIPHRFLLLGGCQINESGVWIPLDNWYFEK